MRKRKKSAKKLKKEENAKKTGKTWKKSPKKGGKKLQSVLKKHQEVENIASEKTAKNLEKKRQSLEKV